MEESPFEWIEFATALDAALRLPRVIGSTGVSLGPVVRRKAASWRVEWSGSVPTGERGTGLDWEKFRD